MKQNITNCLWFDNEAEEAAKLYTSLFPNSGIGKIARYGKEGFEFHHQPEGTVMTVAFKLGGIEFLGLNGGPQFKPNPSISFYAILGTEEETDRAWTKLLEGGSVMMPMDKYPWSEKYGWLQDKFGISWQISKGKLEDVGQRITASLLFVGSQHGRAEEAINFYTSIFENSGIDGILRYQAGEEEKEGTVKHAQFSLLGQKFMAMDSGMEHNFSFNEAISFVLNCETQDEIDNYWNKLTAEGEEGPCGWLKDKFGVSWQVVPVQLQKMLTDSDSSKSQRVMKAFLQMKKFDIKALERAYEGAGEVAA